MKENIFCPACRSKLVVSGQEHLQNLWEHVFTPNEEPSLKNFYTCENQQCECNIYNIKWSEYGEVYAGKKYIEFENIQFINNNDAPFGTYQRQANIEIYKHDEDFYIPLIFGYKIKMEHLYESDLDGNILSKKIAPKLLKDNTYVMLSWKKLLNIFK